MSILKEEIAHYISRNSRFFQERGSYWSEPGSRPKNRPGAKPRGRPRCKLSVQSKIQFLQVLVKCYIYQGIHLFKDCLK